MIDLNRIEEVASRHAGDIDWPGAAIAYEAHVTPQVVLDLIALIRKQEAELKEARSAADILLASCNELTSENERLSLARKVDGPLPELPKPMSVTTNVAGYPVNVNGFFTADQMQAHAAAAWNMGLDYALANMPSEPTIKESLTVAPATADELRNKLMYAAIDCGHSISDREVTLYCDDGKEGNALHQLAERLITAALAAPQQHAQATQTEKCNLRTCAMADQHANGCTTYDPSRYPETRQHAQTADDDLPPLTMALYGTRELLEQERHRRSYSSATGHAQAALSDALHRQIMSLPCDVEKCSSKDWVTAFKEGHRYARHAAAELAAASQQPAAAPVAAAAQAEAASGSAEDPAILRHLLNGAMAQLEKETYLRAQRELELAAIAQRAGSGEPVARILHWNGPKHYPVPHGGICARTYAEFTKGAGENGGYWTEGDPLYAAPPPQPDSDLVKRLTHERDALATAIANAAKKAGIWNGEVTLTGPHLIMFANDLDECTMPQPDSERDAVLTTLMREAAFVLQNSMFQFCDTGDKAVDLARRIYAALDAPQGKKGGAA